MSWYRRKAPLCQRLCCHNTTLMLCLNIPAMASYPFQAEIVVNLSWCSCGLTAGSPFSWVWLGLPPLRRLYCMAAHNGGWRCPLSTLFQQQGGVLGHATLDSFTGHWEGGGSVWRVHPVCVGPAAESTISSLIGVGWFELCQGINQPFLYVFINMHSVCLVT